MKEWFEDDFFWEVMTPYLFPEDRFIVAEEETRQLLELVRPDGLDILDLCCGPGRISVPLARRGYQVTGVDRTHSLLNMAKHRADKAGVAIEWVLEDMRGFDRPQSFDLIINLFTSFGYFEDPADDLIVLEHIAEALRPGGVFLMELMGKEVLSRIFQPTTSSNLKDGSLLVELHEVHRNWSRIKNTWILLREDERYEFTLEHTLYSARELTYLCEKAGLSDIRVFGGFDGSPYDHQAKRMILMAHK